MAGEEVDAISAGGPLSGVTVLDLTALLPGPFATLLLADLGASVIKVESKIGDLLRQVPPMVKGESAYFLSINRNKSSIGLDLRKARARDVFLELAEKSDVVIEGFRPGRATRMGIGSDALLARNPRLIYCSLSGFGHTGPDNRRAGHDITYLARGGVLGAMADTHGAPVMPPLQIGDMAAGTMAAFAICAALFRRERTGEGDVVDISILDTVASWMSFHLEAHHAGAGDPGAAMPLSGRYPFYNVYPTADGGHVALGALEPLFWRDFCVAVDRPELIAEQFADGERRARLFEALRNLFATRTTAEWRELIRDKDLSAEVLAGVEDLVEDPQLRARELLIEVLHPIAGQLLQVDTPVRARSRPTNPAAAPPGLGTETRQVLTELLDLTATEIDNLLEAGVAFESSAPARRIAPEQLP